MSDTENENAVETPGNPIEDFVQAALDQDFNKAGKVFGDVMTIKLDDLMGQEEIKVAGQMFNGDKPEEDDETLDLDEPDDEDESDDEEDENSSE